MYTSQPYSEAMDMRPEVSYIPYAASSKEQTGDIITFAHFEEGDLLSETCNDAESCNESDDNSTLEPLIIEEGIYSMSSVNESDAEPMSTDMLEDICGRRQYHTSINRR